MDPTSFESLSRMKERYPQMDLDMVLFFANTMMLFHRVPIMMEGYFNSLGLSKGRFMVMIQLLSCEDPAGVSIGELLDYYRVSSATMTGIIDTLEAEGLLERIRSPQDRRRVNVRITEAGRSFMDSFLPVHHANMTSFVGGLSIPEREILLGLMQKLHEGIATVLEEKQDSAET